MLRQSGRPLKILSPSQPRPWSVSDLHDPLIEPAEPEK